MTINLAVVGAGYWGPNLIRNFAGLPECRLMAVCDMDPARLHLIGEQFDVRTTTHLEEVLSDQEIKAVAIATPAESHYAVADACLRAGKHVLVEKPIATTSKDAENLVSIAEMAGRILMVGHIFLYDSTVSRLIQVVQAGEAGQIRYVHGVRTSMGGTARLDTNVIWDAFVHDAYVLPALFGCAPQRVMAVGAGYLMPGIEDVAFVTFDFGDGALAQVYVSWYALEKSRKMTVIGGEGILHYDDLAPSRLTRYARRYEQSPERDPQGRPRWKWKDDGSQPIEVAQSEPLRAECQHFIECVATGRKPMTDGHAGLETVRILEACQRSLENNNKWIEI